MKISEKKTIAKYAAQRLRNSSNVANLGRRKAEKAEGQKEEEGRGRRKRRRKKAGRKNLY